MATKYSNIFYSKALQNIPKYVGIFWLENMPSGNPALEALLISDRMQ
jgi:hypothetical protein